ncbi:MAG: hypothetical protein LBE70_03830 [Nitrososphaerota archaeon]|jgi:hypothetical protein|nr:hypothetical protein [Nitrososphaerota archaeon]
MQVELLMGSVNKFLALSFVFLILSSLLVLTITPLTVQAVPKLSVPQFSVKFIDNSHDIPPYNTTTTDPYTGKEIITTHPGFHVEKYDIEVTIKNQPFTPYTNTDGYNCNLYYDLQAKAHFGENWRSYSSYYPFNRISQSDLKETIVTYTLSEDGGFLMKPPSGGLLDFRVEAFTGYWRNPTQYESASGFRDPIFVREESSSGWSSIQTITITYDSSSPSPSQAVTTSESPTTSVDNNNQTPLTNIMLGIIALLLCVIIILAILFLGEKQKPINIQHFTLTTIFSLSRPPVILHHSLN